MCGGQRAAPTFACIAGSHEQTGSIVWHNSDESGVVAQVYGGSVSGLVFANQNEDGSWTELCVGEEEMTFC